MTTEERQKYNYNYFCKNKQRIYKNKKTLYHARINDMREKARNKYLLQKQQGKTYYILNKEKITKQRKIYEMNNKDKISERKRKQRLENCEKYRIYRRQYKQNRRKRDMNYKILENLRIRLRAVLKNNIKTDTTITLIGCSIDILRKHIESNFKFGMMWSNYGRNGWHIDHIIPCASFDLSKPEEQTKCFHYTNLQPLWWRENIIKGDKIIS